MQTVTAANDPVSETQLFFYLFIYIYVFLEDDY